VKTVHHTLKLRHHKHTGKLLPHRHTSYRVLFLLLFFAIVTMALLENFRIAALDYTVSATVPAPLPSGAPVIEKPRPATVTDAEQITVSGTCPVVIPAVIIAIYNDGVLAGSTECTNNGRFSVPIVLMYGEQTLVATVITVTNNEGESSAPVTVTRTFPAEGEEEPEIHKQDGIPTNSLQEAESLNFLQIIPKDSFVTMDMEGNVVWRVAISQGKPPYKVKIDWGDGRTDGYTVHDDALQQFTHQYSAQQAYTITMTVIDANEQKTRLLSVAVSLKMKYVAPFDDTTDHIPAFIGFINRYKWQLYFGAVIAVVFLWYLEHGRKHLVRATKRHHRRRRLAH